MNREQCSSCLRLLRGVRRASVKPRAGDIMLIPPHGRFLYGDDTAANRRPGAARTTLRRRARRIAQRIASDRAARVSGRAGTNTSRRLTVVSDCTSDCTPGANGTRATKAVRSRGRVVPLRLDHLGYYDQGPLDHETGRLEPIDNLFEPKVLPMSPV
jgi:hypothetical protein